MKTIYVASNNPVKIQATRNGFQRMFPDETFDVQGASLPSFVGDQPHNSPVTLQGALNRAHQAAQAFPAADFWVGIEGGIEDQGLDMQAFAWVVIHSPARTSKARSGTFFLPPAVAALVRQGMELGEADDIVFNQSNSKQAGGAIGLLTGGVVDRTGLYEHAVILALAPFKNPQLFDLD